MTEKDNKKELVRWRICIGMVDSALFMRRIVAFYLLIGIKNEEDGGRKTMGERWKVAACKLPGCEH